VYLGVKMSDLIKEFARQAGFKVNWQHEDVQAIKMAQYKEFAELIIFECIKLAVFKGDAATGKAIKDHFGIEK
jgi:hypothetical protein